MMRVLLFLIFFLIFNASAESNKNIKYEYKKFERFDFDEIGVEGEAGSPGDISISPRMRKEFRNKLPERENFNLEMKKAINGIR
jgi:hypothetical protein